MTELNGDIMSETGVETWELEITNKPTLRFRGTLIANVSSSANNASSRYSGSSGRWTELYLYKTLGGKYVCYMIGRTQWQGEHDKLTGAVCETVQDVIAWFGHRWLAKELYAMADIEDVQEIE